MTVVGDLSPLLEAAQEHELVMLNDFWLEGPHRVNSSVVGWRGNLSALYREFAAAPAAMISIYADKARWGDQRFVADTCAGELALWQDVSPGTCVSFKRGALMGADLSNLRVLVSHGQPTTVGPGRSRRLVGTAIVCRTQPRECTRCGLVHRV